MATSPHLELDATGPGTIDGRHVRAVTFQRVRLEYLRETLRGLGVDPSGRSALVIGGGRGPLPGGLARLGLAVTSIDPSAAAVDRARALDRAEGLEITHRVAPAEDLGLAGATFDLVYCADTFEITGDLDRVVGQAAALAPDGVLFYDTVNRTLPARLVYLGAFQAVPFTRIMPPGRYAADRLRPPAEVAAALARHGLHGPDVRGFKPRTLSGLVRAVLRLRAGKITEDRLPDLADFVLDRQGPPAVTYLGHAVRRR